MNYNKLYKIFNLLYIIMSLSNIFNSLEPNQVTIQNISLNKPSLLNKFNILNISKDYLYYNKIWFILYYLSNEITGSYLTDNDFKKFMNSKLEEFQKISNKKYNKSEITKSILNISNDGFTSKQFLADTYDITLYVYYSNTNFIIKFGKGLESYLIGITGDNATLYYNSKNNTFSSKTIENIISFDEIINFKKLKIDELRNLANKLNIETKINKKNKLKKDLSEEIKRQIEIKIIQ
tara:strand:- start:7 stop:714 length:708 start_codon:yes stop_codon:yes gene_type:complete